MEWIKLISFLFLGWLIVRFIALPIIWFSSLFGNDDFYSKPSPELDL